MHAFLEQKIKDKPELEQKYKVLEEDITNFENKFAFLQSQSIKNSDKLKAVGDKGMKSGHNSYLYQ